MHGEDNCPLLSTLPDRTSEAAIACSHPDPDREIGRKRAPAEAGTLKRQAVSSLKIFNRYVATFQSQHTMVRGDAHPVPGARGQPENRLAAGGEDLADQMRLAVSADDPC